MLNKKWEKKDCYIRCKKCGQGKPRSEFGRSLNWRVCEDCK